MLVDVSLVRMETLLFLLSSLFFLVQPLKRDYSVQDLHQLRERTRSVLQRSYTAYMDHAFPKDELRPITCEGMDTWGSYSLTLIDTIDTMAIVGNWSEFRRVYTWLSSKDDKELFDKDINVSVFETNIRILGALLSAHLLAHKAGLEVDQGWPCRGPLLSLAESLARRLLPAFDTPTGLPYGTVNLRHGVPPSETPITCTAGVGTFVVEFGALSRLTSDPLYEETALRAIRSVFKLKSELGLFGNHIDVVTGQWTATESGIGAGVDSLFEYMVKGSALLRRPELMAMFEEAKSAIDTYIKHDDWHFWVSMRQGVVTMPVFQSLEAFFPGTLSMTGDDLSAAKILHNHHQIWRQYGFLPEFYNVPQAEATNKRDGYPLRPELVESAMYLYRATKDPFFVSVGEDMLHSIENAAKTECGYATVKSVRDHTLEDRMESFFLSETLKYLYLLFDPDNFIHNDGSTGEVINTDHGQCVVDAGGYIFNTEGHPIDSALLDCCQSHSIQEIKEQIRDSIMTSNHGMDLSDMMGELLPSRVRKLRIDKEERRIVAEQRRRKYEMHLEQQRRRDREEFRRKSALKEQRRLRLQQMEEEEKATGTTSSSNNESPEVVNVAKAFLISYDLSKAIASLRAKDMSRNALPKTPTENVEENDDDEAIVEDVEEADESEKRSPTHPPLFMSQSSRSEVKHSTPAPSLLLRQSKDESVVEINAQDLANEAKQLSEETRKKKGRSFTAMLGDLIHQMLPQALLTKGKPFDYNVFVERVRNDELNWQRQRTNNVSDYSILRCGSRPFESRFCVQGEFFSDQL